VAECIGATPTSQQRDALLLVGKLAKAKVKLFEGKKLTKEEKKLSAKRGISIRSGHGTGKDAFLAWVYIWLLTCFWYPKGLVTAPTGHQLKDILWSELNKWIRFSATKIESGKSVLTDNLVWQSEKVFVMGAKEEWFVAARTANVKGSEEEQGEALAGMHGDYMVLGIDEASGVPKGVFAPIEGAMTGKMNFAIIIGNPTRNAGYFFDTHHTDRNRWACLHWNSEDSENVTKDYCNSMAEKYGRDSNMYRIRVLGEFPHAEPDALIPLDWIQAAVDRELVQDENIVPVIGVDPARYGDDKTAILTRVGNIIEPIITMEKNDTMEVAGRVATEISDKEPQMTFLDVIGLGAGIYDRLRELGHRVTAVNVAEKAPTDHRFKRLRDELWWRVREKFESGIISIPADDELIGELSSIKYKSESDGRIKVEAKADMKKRGLKSPDKADALCLTYYFRDKVYATTKDAYRQEEVFEPANDELSWMTA
jgi:hypothetical protein